MLIGGSVLGLYLFRMYMIYYSYASASCGFNTSLTANSGFSRGLNTKNIDPAATAPINEPIITKKLPRTTIPGLSQSSKRRLPGDGLKMFEEKDYGGDGFEEMV